MRIPSTSHRTERSREQTLSPFVLLSLVLVLGALACDLSDLTGGGKPSVIITSPPSGSTFREGEEVAVQSVSADARGIVRVELLVDGVVVRTDSAPAPQEQYTLIQTWRATQGTHTIIVRAFNTQNAASDPAAIMVQVLGGAAAQATATTVALAPTATTAPGARTPTTGTECVNNSGFVTDVTVPDGTVLTAGQTFNKIWRLGNNGSCPWGAGYQFVFISGTAMTANTVIPVPSTAPGATADLLVPMTAPAAPGPYTGNWRMRSSAGALFGQTVRVLINVPGAAPAPTATNTTAPSGCSGTPNVFAFGATATTITAGGSTTLQWGAVTNADSFEIDHGVGGQPTPGSVVVSPPSTRTYTATARCGSNPRTAQVTITVNPASPTTVVRCSIQSESGEVIKSGASRAVTQALYVGDDSSNNSYRAFFSFDISDIAGKTINVGNINIGTTTVQGNPFAAPFTGLGTLFVGVLDYGTLNGPDYDAGGSPILSLTSGPAGQHDIKSAIQSAVTASKSRFKVRFHFAAETNSNNAADILHWPSNNNVCLTITYQ